MTGPGRARRARPRSRPGPSRGHRPATGALVAALALVGAGGGAGLGGCAADAGGAGADAGTGPDTVPGRGDPAVDAATIAPLVPGASRAVALRRLATLDLAAPDCRADKVGAAGTGRAFLHERCRLAPSSDPGGASTGDDAADGARSATSGTPPVRAAHVDLVDGTLVRADLHLGRAPTAAERGALAALAGDGAIVRFEPARGGTAEAGVAVLIDARIGRAFPALVAERVRPGAGGE